MNHFKAIIQQNFGTLNQEELELLYSYFVEEKLSKGDYFTQTGTHCQRLSLITSGMLRIYRIVDGREVTQWISTPGNFVTEISSFFFNQPSRLYIQALSDVALLSIHTKAYEELGQKLPQWKEIETQFIAKCFATLEDRVFSHLSLSAEERYHLFFEQNKALFNQVPLQYIASILGMSAETLSRIRGRQT